MTPLGVMMMPELSGLLSPASWSVCICQFLTSAPILRAVSVICRFPFCHASGFARSLSEEQIIAETVPVFY